jgi:drug/metabolite transporter (DMT)-like permease
VVLAALFMTVFIAIFKKGQKIRSGDLKYFIMLAFFEPFCYFMGESYGIRLVSPTMAAIIISTIPVVTPIVAFYFIRERLKVVNIAGLLMSFAGVLVMIAGSGNFLAGSFFGAVLLFFAVISAVFYGVMLKKLSARYSPFVIVRNQNIIGAILFSPIFMLLGFKDLTSTVPNGELVITVFNLAFFASTVAFLMITVAVREMGLSRTNVFINAIPVVTAVFSYLWYGESFGWQKIVGMALVLSGLFISQTGGTIQIMRAEE